MNGRTTLGWTCVEVDSGNGSNGGCDPTGGPPVGAGVGRNERGVVVNGVTAEASAVSAAIHDASGAITTVALFEIGSTVPGAKVGVANLGPAAHPTSIDYLDAGGATVDSARLP